MTEAPQFQEKEEGAAFSSGSSTPEDSGEPGSSAGSASLEEAGGTWLLLGLATPEEAPGNRLLPYGNGTLRWVDAVQGAVQPRGLYTCLKMADSSQAR